MVFCSKRATFTKTVENISPNEDVPLQKGSLFGPKIDPKSRWLSRPPPEHPFGSFLVPFWPFRVPEGGKRESDGLREGGGRVPMGGPKMRSKIHPKMMLKMMPKRGPRGAQNGPKRIPRIDLSPPGPSLGTPLEKWGLSGSILEPPALLLGSQK